MHRIDRTTLVLLAAHAGALLPSLLETATLDDDESVSAFAGYAWLAAVALAAWLGARGRAVEVALVALGCAVAALIYGAAVPNVGRSVFWVVNVPFVAVLPIPVAFAADAVSRAVQRRRQR